MTAGDAPLLEEIKTEKETFQYPTSASEISAIRELFPEVKALSWEEAERLQLNHGKNILAISKPVPWYMLLFHAVVQPFNIILLILAIISAATNDWKTFVVMLVMVTLSSVLKFVQEWKSNVSAEALKNLVENYVVVMRQYRAPDYRDPTFEDVKLMDAGVVVENEIFMEDIVPGDIIKLCAGDLIPGDVQLLISKDLFVSEAALTGESIPVEKSACTKVADIQRLHANPHVGIPISEDERHRPDLCFMGSSVVSGTATAIVLRIGSKTMFGEMALKLAEMQPRNAFQRGIRQVSILFAVIMLIMMPTIFLLMGFLKKDWWDAFSFAIAVAV